MEFFQALGSMVSQRWKDRNYNEECFCEIAHQALIELPPSEHVSLWDVVAWAMSEDQLPRQDDIQAAFGDPPVTVYTGRKFRIEVLFWVSGTPVIHQHSFSGAFHVMHGSSIHSIWDFQPRQQVELRLLMGQAVFKGSEILRKGDSRSILAGNALFHSTYHLDRPSISVVIRTLAEANRQPQYALMPPGIALVLNNDIAAVIRQNQLLGMLLTTHQRSEFNQILRHVLATKDAYSACEFLRTTFAAIEDEEEREALLAIARVRHAGLIDALQPALRQLEIGNKIIGVYGKAGSKDLRFFLALLRNVPERKVIFQLLEQRFPGKDPVRKIVDWVGELSASGQLSVAFDESWLLMLQCLLSNYSAGDIHREFHRHYSSSSLPSAEQFRVLCADLQSYWLLQSLHLGNPFEAGAGEGKITSGINRQSDRAARDLPGGFERAFASQSDQRA